MRPCIAKELLPNIIPTKPVGNGPLTPVGIFIVGLSSVNIVEVVELRSCPALPGVALMSSVMGQRVQCRCPNRCRGLGLAPQSVSRLLVRAQKGSVSMESQPAFFCPMISFLTTRAKRSREISR